MNWVRYYLGYGNLCTAIVSFAIGFFVLSKDWRNPVKRSFFFFVSTVALYALFYSLMMLSRDLTRYIFWWRMMVVPVLFIAVTSVEFLFSWLGIAKKYRLALNAMYIVGVLFDIVIFTPNYIVSPVLKFWGYTPSSTPWAVYFQMGIYIAFWNVGFFALLLSYPRLSYIQKKQTIFFFIGMVIGAVSGTPNFLSFGGITPDMAPLTSPFIVFYVFLFGYAIIRYRAMEIDTVIHKTLLWLLTITFLVAPMGILYQIAKSWMIELSPIVTITIVSLSFLVFLGYYQNLKPRIDHFFRRRKYDYQTILGKVAEKISTTINIEDLTRQLLNEVCEAMYLRNALLYIVDTQKNICTLNGRRGYKEANGEKQRTAIEVFSEDEREKSAHTAGMECNLHLEQWMVEHAEILEKNRMEIDPQYEPIRAEALTWFAEQDIEVLVPLTLDNKVNAVLGLGKKENLQPYTAKDIELLKKLGEEGGVTVFNALHYQELAEKERLDEEMRMGRQIQMMLLPQASPHILGLTVEGMMEPAKEIGGDYYDFITLPNKDSLSIVIGDVSGKGVGAGLLMAMAKTAIHTLSQEEASPLKILLRANAILNQHVAGQKFMTMLYFMWHAHTKTMLYSSAGHEHILIHHKQTGQLETIQSGGIMLGMMPDIERFMEEKQLQMESGDKILLYTDGVTEALDQSQGRFGLDRLKEVFQAHSAKPAKELMKIVRDEVYAFIGNAPQYDDITLVVLEAN